MLRPSPLVVLRTPLLPFDAYLRWAAGLEGAAGGEPGDEALADERQRLRRGLGVELRLDTDYLSHLAEDAARGPALERELLYRPNPSLYRAGGRLRYAEARRESRLPGGIEGLPFRTYRLVAVESNEYLEAILEQAGSGARLAELAAALADDPDVELAEAEAFLGELVDLQLLVPDLEPTLTGEEPLDGLARRAGELGASRLAEALDGARRELAALDGAGLGAAPERYRGLARRLGELDTAGEIAAALTDLYGQLETGSDAAAVEPLRNSTLGTGSSGPPLLFTYLAAADPTGAHAAKAVECLETAIRQMSEQTLAPILYEGFLSVAWVTEHLTGRAFEGDEEEDFNEEIDDLVHQVLSPPGFGGDYDLIRGLVGIGVFALRRAPLPRRRRRLVRTHPGAAASRGGRRRLLGLAGARRGRILAVGSGIPHRGDGRRTGAPRRRDTGRARLGSAAPDLPTAPEKELRRV